MQSHAEEIPCSERTLYHYIDAGYLTARNIDMHRTVRYRKRKHYKNQPKIQVLLLTNHINNTTRPKLHGMTPMKKALQSFDKKAMEKLGLKTIRPDDICLKPDLLK